MIGNLLLCFASNDFTLHESGVMQQLLDRLPIGPGDPDEPSDAFIVGRIRQGDGAAFEIVMRRHNQMLFRLARSIVRNDAEAEDVVQETYVRAFSRLGDFAGASRLSTWLARIAINEALGRLRHRRRFVAAPAPHDGDRPDAEDALATRRSDHPDPERLAASSELRRLLEQAIDDLPDGFRSVFMLRAVEQMSVAETAECLGLRPETVKTRFHRARLLLQQALNARAAAATPDAFAFDGARCDRIVENVLLRVGLRAQAGRARH